MAVQSATTDTGIIAKPAEEPARKLAIICSKGTLDMAYPGLILANGARMVGIETTIFFTFWGLDVVNNKKIDDLHVPTVGNPSMHIPTMVGGLPGMEHLASHMMKKQMEELEIPSVREMIEMLEETGAEMYACQLAMDMFKLEKDDLVPQVKDVLTVMDFMELTEGAQVLFV